MPENDVRQYKYRSEARHQTDAYLLHLVARIALVSEDRARQIEMIILRMYQTGQISKVTEDQLIGLLEQVSIDCYADGKYELMHKISIQADEAQSKGKPKKGTIVVCISCLCTGDQTASHNLQFQRRKAAFDDDDDF